MRRSWIQFFHQDLFDLRGRCRPRRFSGTVGKALGVFGLWSPTRPRRKRRGQHFQCWGRTGPRSEGRVSGHSTRKPRAVPGERHAVALFTGVDDLLYGPVVSLVSVLLHEHQRYLFDGHQHPGRRHREPSWITVLVRIPPITVSRAIWWVGLRGRR